MKRRENSSFGTEIEFLQNGDWFFDKLRTVLVASQRFNNINEWNAPNEINEENGVNEITSY